MSVLSETYSREAEKKNMFAFHLSAFNDIIFGILLTKRKTIMINISVIHKLSCLQVPGRNHVDTKFSNTETDGKF